MFLITTFSFLGFLFVLCVIVPACAYLGAKGKNYTAALIRNIGTCIPLLIGFLRFIRTPSLVGFLLILAISCGLAGDIYISSNFQKGLCGFIGETFIIILCYLVLDSFHITSIILLIILSIILMNYYHYYFNLLGRNKKPLILYGLLVLQMGCMAIIFPFFYSFKGILMALGGIFFALSNFLTARTYICRSTFQYSCITLGAYYLAQILLVLSISFH